MLLNIIINDLILPKNHLIELFYRTLTFDFEKVFKHKFQLINNFSY